MCNSVVPDLKDNIPGTGEDDCRIVMGEESTVTLCGMDTTKMKQAGASDPFTCPECLTRRESYN